MRRPVRMALGLAGGLLGAAAVAAGVGAARWRWETAGAVEQLGDGGGPVVDAPITPEQLTGLPAPVARYFEFALPPGQPRIRTARVEHAGEFRTGGREGAWSPFVSEQHFATEPPGFVWDAAIRIAPLLAVRVRDSYLHGTGAMEARFLSLLPVMDQHDSTELNAGALQRYLAEAVWLPTALLPRAGLTWEPIDAHSARATLADGANEVSLDFHFGEAGEIVRAYTPARFREVSGRYVATPWQCRYREYARVHGVQVPLEGEVEWLLPEGPLLYWRGRIRDLRYELSGAGN